MNMSENDFIIARMRMDEMANEARLLRLLRERSAPRRRREASLLQRVFDALRPRQAEQRARGQALLGRRGSVHGD